MSVQLTLDGHFFSEPAADALRGAEEVELLTAATLLVPRAFFRPTEAAALFAAAGMPLAEGMCTVCAAGAEGAETEAAGGGADTAAEAVSEAAADVAAAADAGEAVSDAAFATDAVTASTAAAAAAVTAAAAAASPLAAVMALAETTRRTIEERCGGAVRYTTPLLRPVEAAEPTVWICDTGRVLYLRLFDPALQLAEALPVETDEERAYLVERLCERIDPKRYVLLLDDRAGGFRRLRNRFKKTIPCE